VLPSSIYRTVISVILKPGASGVSPADYRPISLINCENKIITRLISNRMAEFVPNLIHINQTGFLKSRHLN
jgi:hypothetical protein